MLWCVLQCVLQFAHLIGNKEGSAIHELVFQYNYRVLVAHCRL